MERCDSLLLTDLITLGPEGEVHVSEIEKNVHEMLAKIAEIANTNAATLWAEIPCSMSEEQWEKLLTGKC